MRGTAIERLLGKLGLMTIRTHGLIGDVLARQLAAKSEVKLAERERRDRLYRDLIRLYREQAQLVKLREVSRIHRKFIGRLEEILRRNGR